MKTATKPKKPPGQYLFLWKLEGSFFPNLTKGATFKNRADSKRKSLGKLAVWKKVMGGKPVLLKQI